VAKTERTSPGTATSFRPKNLALTPRQFGKSASDLTPAEDVDETAPKFLAAQFQHRVCNALREALLARNATINDFATQLKDTVPGMGYDRMVRVLRGETLIQVADLVTWAGSFREVREIVLSDKTWPMLSAPTRNPGSLVSPTP
jgi:hypothetical protein